MKIHFKLKQYLSACIDETGLSDYIIRKRKPRVIIGYHRVLPHEKATEYMAQSSMWTTPQSFEKQIQWMKRIGLVVSLAEIVRHDISFSKPVFALTFDDGWKDNYDNAFPILQKYHVPATIFLATGAIESGHLFWPEELCYKTKQAIAQNGPDDAFRFFKECKTTRFLKQGKNDITILLDVFIEHLKIIDAQERKSAISIYYSALRVDPGPVSGQMLTWADIGEMCKSNVSFGSHTHSHLILKGADPKAILNELVTSKKIIENHLSMECPFFCYPNARYNPDDDRLLKNAGFRYGITLNPSELKTSDSPFLLPRFLSYNDLANPLGYFKLRLLRVPLY
jgi:peptidoglycan/xylan/chitin deacetylase (PgdA/CDA1 family)